MNGIKKYCRTDNHLIVSTPNLLNTYNVHQTLSNTIHETHFARVTMGNGRIIVERLYADGCIRCFALSTVWPCLSRRSRRPRAFRFTLELKGMDLGELQG